MKLETERSDGKIVVQQKGTLQLLDEWLRKHFHCNDWGAMGREYERDAKGSGNCVRNPLMR